MPTSSRVAPSGRPESDAAAAGQPPGSLRPKSFGWLVRVVRSVLDDKTVAEGADYAEGVEVRHAVERAPGAERHPAGAAVGCPEHVAFGVPISMGQPAVRRTKAGVDHLCECCCVSAAV